MKMTIYRDGKAIELTEDEIYQAYEIQKFEFAKDTVIAELESGIYEEAEELLQNEQFILDATAAYLSNKQREEDDTYSMALDNAVYQNINRYATKQILEDEER